MATIIATGVFRDRWSPSKGTSGAADARDHQAQHADDQNTGKAGLYTVAPRKQLRPTHQTVSAVGGLVGTALCTCAATTASTTRATAAVPHTPQQHLNSSTLLMHGAGQSLSHHGSI